MKPFIWDEEKNERLLQERGVSFEMVEQEVTEGRYRIEDNRSRNHKGQKVFIVGFTISMPPERTIIYVVPFIEHEDVIELKTMYTDLYWQMRFGASL
jgi:uncharacterized DUF497 family protein